MNFLNKYSENVVKYDLINKFQYKMVNKLPIIKFVTLTFNFKKFDISIILKKLYNLGCRNILVEGGNELTKNFLIKKIFNQFTLLSGDRYFGDDRSVIAGFGLASYKLGVIALLEG